MSLVFIKAPSMSQMSTHEHLARQAIDLARQARLAGNHPFGALFSIDDEVVLTAHNTVTTDRDPTAHAESNLVATPRTGPSSSRAAIGTVRPSPFS